MVCRRRKVNSIVQLSTLAVVFAGAATAQVAISARAGMVHHIEGKVFVADKEVVSKTTEFPEVKEGQELRTDEGRAEVLLTPGVFLRIAENSAFRMVSSRLSDVRIDVLRGSIIIEAAEIGKDNAITVLFRDAEIALRKHGVYRVDADQNRVRVYDGEALVARGGQTVTLKDGRETVITGVLAAEKFNSKVGDAFLRWAARRAEYVAVANMSAARYIGDSDRRSRYQGWYFNPYFGCFTYLPGSGIYSSWFGPRYYSVRTIWIVTQPRYEGGGPGGAWAGSQTPTPSFNRDYGYSTVPSSSAPSYSGNSGASSSSSPAAASAPSPRGGEATSPRGDSGGRGR
jgi:hypothetical protein